MAIIGKISHGFWTGDPDNTLHLHYYIMHYTSFYTSGLHAIFQCLLYQVYDLYLQCNKCLLAICRLENTLYTNVL